MSSDSELDEFFDVEESTPIKESVNVEKAVEKTSSEQDLFELERKKLLDQLHDAEQRRKREEEEFKKQIAELDAKRQSVRGSVIAVDDVSELDKANSKLTSFRQELTKLSNPEVAPSKPPRTYQYNSHNAPRAQSQPQGVAAEASTGTAVGLPPSVLVSTCDSDVATSDNTCDKRQRDYDGDAGITSDNDPNDVDIHNDDDDMLDSSSEDPLRISGARSLIRDIDISEDITQLRGYNVTLMGAEHTTDELVKEACAAGLLKSEPDIISSTKPSSSQVYESEEGTVGGPGGPVAPPRRRKKTKAAPHMPATVMETTDSDLASVLLEHTVPVLPPSITDDEDDDVDHEDDVTRNLEQSLDLETATSGSSFVRAEEDEAAKAESTIVDDLSSTTTSSSTRSISLRDDTSSTGTLTPLASPHTTDPPPPHSSSSTSATTSDAVMGEAAAAVAGVGVGEHPLQGPIAECTTAAVADGKPSSTNIKPKYSRPTDQELIEAVTKSLKTNSLEKGKIFIKREDGDGSVHIEGIARPRSNSGSRYLTDKEILDKVQVLNLDTGEQILLSEAEHKLPTCANPLSLHIMRRTQEYSSDSSLHKGNISDDDIKDLEGTKTISSLKQPSKRRKIKLKEMLGKTVHKIRSVTASHHDEGTSDDDDEAIDCRRMIKVKAAHAHKGPYDFDLLVPIQELGGEHLKAVWCMKFSHCGKLLATGGQDNKLRVWVLKDAFAYFEDMRQKYNEVTKVSPTPSQDSLSSQSSDLSKESEATSADDDPNDQNPFMRKPFCIYKGHTADLLDLSWSKNYFILTSSMDKMVRLWHISRKECLCCFQHIDFVTAIAFHPKDDRYFLSGSLDGKIRMWSIPDKKVALWNEVQGQTKLITAANFCLHGRFAVVGTYDGRCIFYSTDKLKYHTQIHVRSTRGRNARGRKITGVDPLPGGEKVLVTSNDSRIRLYDLRDLTLTCKYRGCANNSSQIKASFSQNGKYIICGSEDHFVYVWKTQHEFYKLSSARKDRNEFWEGIKAHTAVVTVAIFAPNPGQIIKPQFTRVDSDDHDEEPAVRGEVIVSADFSGNIRVFINKFKPGSG